MSCQPIPCVPITWCVPNTTTDWGLQFPSLVGPPGPTGPIGPTGATGPQGPQGTGSGGLLTAVSLPLLVTGTTLSINLATPGTAGTLAGSDKIKLDSTTQLNVASSLVQRDTQGNIAIGSLQVTTSLGGTGGARIQGGLMVGIGSEPAAGDLGVTGNVGIGGQLTANGSLISNVGIILGQAINSLNGIQAGTTLQVGTTSLLTGNVVIGTGSTIRMGVAGSFLADADVSALNLATASSTPTAIAKRDIAGNSAFANLLIDDPAGGLFFTNPIVVSLVATDVTLLHTATPTAAVSSLFQRDGTGGGSLANLVITPATGGLKICTGASPVAINCLYPIALSVVLTGGAPTEQKNIPLTGRGFTVKPEWGIVSPANTNYIASYIPAAAGSTSTNAVIEFRRIDGTNIPASTTLVASAAFLALV